MPPSRTADLTVTGTKILGLAERHTPIYSAAEEFTTLFSYTVPPRGLQFEGDMIELWAWGHVAPGVEQQIKVKLGTSVILDTGNVATLSGDYVLHATLVRAADGTINSTGSIQFATTHNIQIIAAVTDADPDSAVDLVISAVGPTVNDISVAQAIVNFRGQA